MKIQKRWMIGWIVLLGTFFTACGSAQAPTLVASYPKLSTGEDFSSAAIEGPVVLETVYLALEVNDPEGAAEKAAWMAYGYGGCETSRYAWYADGGLAVSQEILVPLDQSENLRARLLQMGWKTDESVVRHSDSWFGPGDGRAQFSIQYLPARYEIEWDHSHVEDFLSSVCRFFMETAVVFKQFMASLLLAAAVVIPIFLMIVGAFTTVRWLFKR
jgi:hypothetical protein